MIDLFQAPEAAAALGFTMIVLFTVLVMSNRMPALAALVIIPVFFGLVAGAGGEIGQYMIDGILRLAPLVVMITFAVLYFSLMLDAGLFDPLVNRIIAIAGDDALRITMGTAAAGLVIAMTGDGISTALIIITAFLPVYRRMKMDTAVLGAIIAAAIAVQNLTPWGGPTPRVAASLNLDPSALYIAVLPSVIAGNIAVLVSAWLLGMRERRRLAAGIGVPGMDDQSLDAEGGMASITPDESAKRPQLIWWNLLLTGALIGALGTGILSPVALFPIAAALALMLNYPTLNQQRERIASHGENLASLVLLFFAAGIFTGILNGSGMIEAMADVSVSTIPAFLGNTFAPIMAVASMPFTYFLPLDAYYFGVTPILSQTASTFGILPQETAAASLMGLPVHVLSPLLPSLYVFSAILGITPGRNLRVALPWAIFVSFAMIATGLLFGVFPLFASAR